MDTALESCLTSLRFEGGTIHGRMEVIPLFSGTHRGGDYLTLAQALAQNRLVITEVGKSGTVPKLMVRNRGKIPVLLIDGEELAGAKQNRVLNTTIIVPGESEIVIPVSCTEHGRWSYTSPVFHDSEVMMDYRLRSKKMASVAMSRKFRGTLASDQLEIWDDIGEMARKAKVHSRTGAMKDIFSAREKAMDEYMHAFPLQPGQQGILVYMDDQPAGMEFLSRPESYARIHEKLLRSYVLEALIDDEAPPARAAGAERPAEFIQRVLFAHDEAYPGVGLGTEHRLEGPDLVGSALVHEGLVVHLACFTGTSTGSCRAETRMAGFRARYGSRASGAGGIPRNEKGRNREGEGIYES